MSPPDQLTIRSPTAVDETDFDDSKTRAQLRSCEKRRDRLERQAAAHLPSDVNLTVILHPDVPTAFAMDTEVALESDGDELPTDLKNAIDDETDYLIAVSTREPPIPIEQTDFDTPVVLDYAVQAGYILHEIGHLLYTDFDALATLLDGVDTEHEPHLQNLFNYLEDGAIERAVRVTGTEHIRARQRLINHFLRIPTSPEEETWISALGVAGIDLAIYETGTLGPLLDPADTTYTFKTADHRDVFLELLPEFDRLVAEVLTEPYPVSRYARIEEFWKAEIQPRIDQIQDRDTHSPSNSDVQQNSQQSADGDANPSADGDGESADGEDSPQDSPSNQPAGSDPDGDSSLENSQEPNPQPPQQSQQSQAGQDSGQDSGQTQATDQKAGAVASGSQVGDSPAESPESGSAGQQASNDTSDAEADGAESGNMSGDSALDNIDPDEIAPDNTAEGSDQSPNAPPENPFPDDADRAQKHSAEGSLDGDVPPAPSSQPDGQSNAADQLSEDQSQESGQNRQSPVSNAAGSPDQSTTSAAPETPDDQSTPEHDDQEQSPDPHQSRDSPSNNHTSSETDSGEKKAGGSQSAGPDGSSPDTEGNDKTESEARTESEHQSEVGDDTESDGQRSAGETQLSMEEALERAKESDGDNSAGEEPEGNQQSDGDTETRQEKSAATGPQSNSSGKDSQNSTSQSGSGSNSSTEKSQRSGIDDSTPDQPTDESGKSSGKTSQEHRDSVSDTAESNQAGGASPPQSAQTNPRTDQDGESRDRQERSQKRPQVPGGGDRPEVSEDYREQERDNAAHSIDEDRPDDPQLDQDLDRWEQTLEELDQLYDTDDTGEGSNGASAENLPNEIIACPEDNGDGASTDRWKKATSGDSAVAALLDQALDHRAQGDTRRGLPAGEFDSRMAGEWSSGNTHAFRHTDINGAPRYLLIVVLDRSASMRGSTIEAAEHAVIEFCHEAEQIGIDVIIMDFYAGEMRLAKPIHANLEEVPETLASGSAAGGTPLSQALALARTRVQMEAGTNLHPFLLTITDGEPADEEAYKAELEETEQELESVLGLTLTANSPVTDEELAEQADNFTTHEEANSLDTSEISRKLEELALTAVR